MLVRTFEMTQSAERLNDKNQKLFKDRLFESGFGYTDIVKCDGEFFLKHAKLKFVRGLKITMRYLQLG